VTIPSYRIAIAYNQDVPQEPYWVAWLPDFGLSACSAVGDTPIEAVQKLENSKEEVFQLYLDKKYPFPHPTVEPKLANDWGVDVDGVLMDLLTPCFEVMSKMLGREIGVQHMSDFSLEKLLPPERVNDFWKEIGQPGLCRKLAPLPGAVEGLATLREIKNVYLVTSYLHDAPQWVHDRDLAVQEHFHVTRAHMVHTRAKKTFYGAALIDDKPENIEEWAKQHPNGRPILWLQPYNRSHLFSPAVENRVIRTNDWKKVVEIAKAT
jgi:5'(3')-deoxyribonucleotidase/predicted RNase H-like HicB family nuclease